MIKQTAIRASVKKINTIMLVDDDPVMNMINKKILNNYSINIDVQSFTDAVDALIVAKTNPPDLIILDINMPVMNGWQFLRALAKKKMKINVVILSSSIDPSEKGKALLFKNVIHFFNKPLTVEQLNLLDL